MEKFVWVDNGSITGTGGPGLPPTPNSRRLPDPIVTPPSSSGGLPSAVYPTFSQPIVYSGRSDPEREKTGLRIVGLIACALIWSGSYWILDQIADQTLVPQGVLSVPMIIATIAAIAIVRKKWFTWLCSLATAGFIAGYTIPYIRW